MVILIRVDNAAREDGDGVVKDFKHVDFFVNRDGTHISGLGSGRKPQRSKTYCEWHDQQPHA